MAAVAAGRVGWNAAATATRTMISNHPQFLDAIRDKKLVRLVFYSLADGGTVDRECAPLDYGPTPGTDDPLNRYWVWDHANTAGANPLGLISDQIVSVQVLGKDFIPHDLGLAARSWCVARDWPVAPAAGDRPVGA